MYTDFMNAKTALIKQEQAHVEKTEKLKKIQDTQ
jgi:hypothetical protein